jgi:hypothetical protein
MNGALISTSAKLERAAGGLERMSCELERINSGLERTLCALERTSGALIWGCAVLNGTVEGLK